MGKDINVVVITGNLTKDPELKQVGDQALVKMRLATNKSSKKDGEWVDSPMYFDVDAWGRTAEVCAQYLVRGSAITIDGHLDWREWTNDAGEKRQAVSIVADKVKLPTRREAEQALAGDVSSRQAPPPAAAPKQQAAPRSFDPANDPDLQDDSDQDIPF